MKKSVVKHHNDLNTVVMRKWTTEEMNFFFAIITKARENGTKTLFFSQEEVKELTRFRERDEHKERWEKTIESCARKVTQLNYVEKIDFKIRAMTLFECFEVDLKKGTVEIKLSPNYEYILNRLNAAFTTFELDEFINIRSTYAKTMYRLLKQWRTVGVKEFSIEELRLLLDVPKSYQICHIDKSIIQPTLKELSAYFKNLKVKKVKSNKKGNPVLGYEFIWQAEEIKNIPEQKQEGGKVSVRYVNSSGYRDFSDLIE